MARRKRSLGEIEDGPQHIAKVERSHLAQEMKDLYGLDNPETIAEHVRRLRPCVRHQALGCKADELPTVPMLAVHLAAPDDRGYFGGVI